MISLKKLPIDIIYTKNQQSHYEFYSNELQILDCMQPIDRLAKQLLHPN